ncbi:MAG: hypothetical protein HQM08_17155 [Candidatus Riflebacteria bacterium]|nr:hypothetical protein [Candidatus Riflebacteria bacterium]
MKNRILLFCFVVLLLIWAIIIFRHFHGKSEIPENLDFLDNPTFLQNEKNRLPDFDKNDSSIPPKNEKHLPKTGGWGQFGSGGTPAPLSSADLQVLKVAQEKIDEFSSQIDAEREKFFLAQANNPNLATETRELYRLRLCKPFREGKNFLASKDFSRAEASFLQILSDNTTSPVTKGIALQYLANCARELGSGQKYFEYMKQLGELQSKEDLTVMGLDRTNAFLSWIKDQERYFLAINNPQNKEIILSYLREVKQMDRNEAEKYFAWKIKQVKEDLKSRSKVSFP